jgi:hypothetical protein
MVFSPALRANSTCGAVSGNASLCETEGLRVKEPYTKPVVTRVRIEDKKVVAMAACNFELEQQPGSYHDAEYVYDRFGNRLLTFDSSI